MKYKKITCIYPYDKILPYYAFFPPIGIEYIAAAIKDLVDEVKIVDCRYETDYVPKVEDKDADLFCVSVGWHYEIDVVAKLIESLPKDVMTIVGGKYASENVEDLLKKFPNIDVIVRGDGEETMRDIIQSDSLENILGISYRDKNNNVVHNENRLLGAVSNTVFPDRNLRRYKYDISHRKETTGLGFDAVITSRGCPFNCKFCSFNFDPLGQKRSWSARSARSVVDELKATDAKIVMFIDENFFADVKRAHEICDLIIEEKLGKLYIGQARVSVGNHPELVKKMRKAGFRLLLTGIESSQDKTLKQLQKGFTVAEVKNAFKVLRDSKIITLGYFIIGNIGETEKEMMEIPSFAKDIGVDLISTSRLRYEKYSGLEELLANNSNYYVNEENFIISKQYGTKEIKSIRKRIKREFYDRKQVIHLTIKALRMNNPPWIFVRRFAYAYLKEEIRSRTKSFVTQGKNPFKK